MRIIIGDHNYNVAGDGEQFILVSSKLVHPRYNAGNSQAYDFAILKLATPVSLPSATAGLVCLPSDLSQTFDGATLTIRYSILPTSNIYLQMCFVQSFFAYSLYL
jgi:hypothetical protein